MMMMKLQIVHHRVPWRKQIALDIDSFYDNGALNSPEAIIATSACRFF